MKARGAGRLAPSRQQEHHACRRQRGRPHRSRPRRARGDGRIRQRSGPRAARRRMLRLFPLRPAGRGPRRHEPGRGRSRPGRSRAERTREDRDDLRGPAPPTGRPGGGSAVCRSTWTRDVGPIGQVGAVVDIGAVVHRACPRTGDPTARPLASSTGHTVGSAAPATPPSRPSRLSPHDSHAPRSAHGQQVTKRTSSSRLGQTCCRSRFRIRSVAAQRRVATDQAQRSANSHREALR